MGGTEIRGGVAPVGVQSAEEGRGVQSASSLETSVQTWQLMVDTG